MSFVLGDYAELEGKRSNLGIGSIVHYRTPLSGGGNYIGKVVAIEGEKDNLVYKVKVEEIVVKSANPISPKNKKNSYHYVTFLWEV